MENVRHPDIERSSSVGSGDGSRMFALANREQGKPATMSSREIAELVEKRHDNVKRTIDSLVSRCAIGIPQIEKYSDSLGRSAKEYRIGKRDSYVIVAQLSPEFTARLVDRWQQLEDHAAANHTVIPKTYSEALRLAADLADQNGLLSATLAAQKPKVEALDRIATADGALNLTAAAKALQIQPIKFCESLRKMGWIYRRPGGKSNLGYQNKVQAGWLTHKVRSIALPDGSERIVEQVLVTPRGLTKLAVLLGQREPICNTSAANQKDLIAIGEFELTKAAKVSEDLQ